MTETLTDYGWLIVGEKEKLFAHAAERVALAATDLAEAGGRPLLCAFSGGSTPQDWYRWCVQTGALPAAVTATAQFTVSDERCVPLADDQSNFGHADRLLLEPLGVPAAHRQPWLVALPAAEAAAAYAQTVARLAGPGRAFDVCFLGLGDDSHTASLFPGSPLLRDDGGQLFAAVEAPGKGWRLTITPAGLRACGQIVVMAVGAGKARALQRVLRGPADPANVPAQILRTCADRVVWLVDAAAAAEL